MWLREVSITFVGGMAGALASSLALWLCGAVGLTRLLGVALAPAFTLSWLYPRLVWGGLWGWLFLLPAPKVTYSTRGLFLSLAPSVLQLLIVFPEQGHGLAGFRLGYLTPGLVLLVNAIWGLVAAVWVKYARHG